MSNGAKPTQTTAKPGSAEHYADAMAQAVLGPTTADLAFERGHMSDPQTTEPNGRSPAYHQGVRAKQNGHRQRVCPYDLRKQDGRDWMRGWIQAEPPEDPS